VFNHHAGSRRRSGGPRVLARDLGALALVVVAGPWMLGMAPPACSAGIAASAIVALESQITRDAAAQAMAIVRNAG